MKQANPLNLQTLLNIQKNNLKINQQTLKNMNQINPKVEILCNLQIEKRLKKDLQALSITQFHKKIKKHLIFYKLFNKTQRKISLKVKISTKF